MLWGHSHPVVVAKLPLRHWFQTDCHVGSRKRDIRALGLFHLRAFMNTVIGPSLARAGLFVRSVRSLRALAAVACRLCIYALPNRRSVHTRGASCDT